MDNLCHTLAGLAMSEAGLKKNTRLAAVTCMIGANLPDVDIVAYQWGRIDALGFRRGWTHGILAMAVWPFVLTGIVLLADRLWRRLRPASRLPLPASRSLLLAAALSIWSHPLLDLTNTYGVRLLMPFSGRWFYGDALFIIDPWVWATLLLGILFARRAQRVGGAAPYRPARIAIAAMCLYIATMAGISRNRAAAARAELAGQGLVVGRVMAAPQPVNPRPRAIVAEVPGGYLTFPGGLRFERQDTLPASRRVAGSRDARTFLSWARFPVFEGDVGGHCAPRMVCLRDLRYYGQGWAEVALPVIAPLSSPPTP
jgi:inner membrane protein